MRSVKAAVYLRLSGDPTLMNLLDGNAPFPARLPPTPPTDPPDDWARITYDGETLVTRGSKEDITLTLHVWTVKHDPAEIIAQNIDRLFRAPPGLYWYPLDVSDGKAYVRREFGVDAPNRSNELNHRVVRLRILYGWN